MDGVLMTAIGWHEGMSEEEEGARIHRLIDREGVFDGRYRAINRRYEELVEKRRVARDREKSRRSGQEDHGRNT